LHTSKTGGVRIKQQTINIKPNASDVIELEMSGKIGKHLVFITDDDGCLEDAFAVHIR